MWFRRNICWYFKQQRIIELFNRSYLIINSCKKHLKDPYVSFPKLYLFMFHNHNIPSFATAYNNERICSLQLSSVLTLSPKYLVSHRYPCRIQVRFFVQRVVFVRYLLKNKTKFIQIKKFDSRLNECFRLVSFRCIFYCSVHAKRIQKTFKENIKKEI